MAPLKADAMERAARDAKALIEKVRGELKQAGFDQRILAPYPSGRLGRAEYHVALGKYQLLCALTEWDYDKQPGSRMGQGPNLVKMNAGRCAKFIEDAKRDAAFQYIAFVLKLVQKVGPVQAATLHGNHVWSYSVLTVTKADGTKENWKTQQIVNVSKLGKLFNQWPTRKVK